MSVISEQERTHPMEGISGCTGRIMYAPEISEQVMPEMRRRLM